MKKFLFTCGDVNGIGPEICIKALNTLSGKRNEKFVLAIPANVFRQIIKKVNADFPFKFVNKNSIENDDSFVSIIDIGKTKQKYGMPTKESGEAAFKAITIGVELAKQKNIDAIITAPLSKHSFELAGINFPGHTEFLADATGVKNYSMMFLSNKMKVALATIHIPIADVSKNISKEKLKKLFYLMNQTLIADFRIVKPKIAALGLNPHAGEEGRIGKEEKKKIIPAIKETIGINISGPFVPDAFFANKLFKNFDLTISMYHDQALIPFKMLSFSSGVNYTAGLPVVRTSPDHGTAFDIAGKCIADSSSIVSAYKWAALIIRNRMKNEK
ncbi:MAG: 4-hydroxythreonine-4-phosphate dehydrogenase PdxA [Chlorobi bacterium]|nr:4-hydroxythreonine-4-phosphate dehydrogenase PdxA [Chlorobiota bacterium]